MSSVLPLHRAVAGLHYHGSEKLLINMIDTLCTLGANVNATDSTGNTVLHKAIQVCTSKSVVSVVSALLLHGANIHTRGDDDMTPLHTECMRVRTASTYVISSLIEAGADPSAICNGNRLNVSGDSCGLNALTMILQCGAAATAVASGSATLSQTGIHHRSSRLNTSAYHDEALHDASPLIDDNDSRRVASRRVWVRAAQTLLIAGSTTGVKNHKISRIIIYKRDYYESLNRNIRFTIDKDLEYKLWINNKIKNDTSRNFMHKNFNIIEAKYDFKLKYILPFLISAFKLKSQSYSKFVDYRF